MSTRDWGIFKLISGDCLETLRGMAANSVDSIVTDPPYGLSFMGKKWDYDVPGVDVWAECLRVLKPGGHMLAFAGTRTQHRMAVRIEDAGFEIRDMIAWVYGSGFPKSHNGPWGGTALKPALEPITVARKPLVGTVAANVLEFGTGALDIDGCRVATNGEVTGGSGAAKRGTNALGDFAGNGGNTTPEAGRWPANLIHDGSEEVLAAFPQAPGQQGRARTDGAAQENNTYGALNHVTKLPGPRGDAGSAARFFYCAKARRSDRGEGNDHPTVKPTDLMRYLCRLVTPRGGLILDPYTGSGSTGKAAVKEGFRFIGCEMENKSMDIAERRIVEAAFGTAALEGLGK